MRWVNPRMISARSVPVGTGPPYGVGLPDGLLGQAGVALACEMGGVPRPCAPSQGDIAERSRMPPSRVAARRRSTRFGRIDRSHFGVAGRRRPGPLDSLASGRENRIDDWCQVRTTLTWNPVLDRIADTPEGAAHRRSNGRWARTPLVTVQSDEVIGGGWRDQLARLARARGYDRFPL